MKRWIAMVSILVSVLTANASAQDTGRPNGAAAKKNKTYGPPVKLDISGNECIKKGQEAYIQSLFYEEFKTLSECQAAIARRS